MNDRPCLSVVLPCYNEAPNLPAVIASYGRAGTGRPFELILVDNGSTDDTAHVLREQGVGPAHAFARTVRVPANLGYGHGIQAGLRMTRGEVVGWSHADQQCRAEDVFRAWHRLMASDRPSGTVVKGLREARPWWECWTTVGMQSVARMLLGLPLRDINAQPKVFHRSLMESWGVPPTDWSFDLHVLHAAVRRGWKVLAVPVKVHPRAHGTSKWAFGILSRWRHIAGVLRHVGRLRHDPDGGR